MRPTEWCSPHPAPSGDNVSWQVHGQDGLFVFFIHILFLELTPAEKSPTGFSFLKYLFHILDAKIFSL